MKPEILHSKSFVTDALALVLDAAESAIRARGIFRIALSGGNTPKPVYAALASVAADWSRWEISFGDERCVPPDHAQSNYRMAREAWFDPAGVPAASVLRMRGEDDPASAAAAYEADLLARSTPYVHDLILLGMGDDGHTASLFPGTQALHETTRLVVANAVPQLSTHRITMTYPLLNAARHVCFLVTSTGKESVLEEVFSGTSHYPSAAVAPSHGRLTWLLGGTL